MRRKSEQPIRRILVEMTAAAQLARDALPYGTVLVDGRRYTMREDWWDVADRAALKYARKGAADGAGARVSEKTMPSSQT